MQFIFTKLGSTLLVIALIAFGYFIYSALGGTTVNVTLKTNPDLESGLVGHWTFDGKDMISNVADVSGQGNHGALQGQTSTTTAIGVIGQALDFDGSDDYVNVGTVTGGGGGGSTATIDTTTNTLSIVRGSVRYIHYANGYYWAFVVRAASGDRYTDVFSSSDGSSWSEQGSAPVQSHNSTEFAARFDGTNVITIGRAFNSTTRYRQGVLESDGTVTWGTERDTSETGNTIGTGGSNVQRDSGGKPWVAIYDGGDDRFESNFNSADDGSGSWTLDTLARPVSSDNFPHVILFPAPDTSETMLMIVSGVTGTIRETLNDGTAWDSFTTLETDAHQTATQRDYGTSAVQMADDSVHLVYITTTGAIKHIKRSGTTPWGWSDVDTDVTGLTSHTKLTLGRDGTDLYVFYDKGDEKIYYRKYDGSWGSEQNLKTDSTAIVGAISSYELSANDEIGVIWAEGSGSPYDVKFASIPTDFTKTISFWMKADDTTDRKVIDIDGTDQIELSASSVVTATSFPGTTVVYVDGSSASATVATSTWHHVVITDTTGVNASAMDIGRVSSGYFDGQIDDVRIYNRALSAEEIKRLYDLGGTTHVNVTLKTSPDLENGLVGHWTFDGADMNNGIVDKSGNGNTGVLSGQTSTTTAFGVIGQALSFDGSDDYVGGTTADFEFGSSPFSVSTWIRQGAVEDDDDTFFSYNRTGQDSVFQIRSGFEGTDGKRFMLNIHTVAGGWASRQTDSDVFTDTDWHHYIVTKDGTTVLIYKDGVSIAHSQVGAAIPATLDDSSTDTFNIGNRIGAASQYFDGQIDDVRIYNRALSAMEITKLYNLGATSKINTTIEAPAASSAGGPTLATGLVGHWTFDGNDMNDGIVDKSGNGNTGVLSGQTSTTTAFGVIGQALEFDGSDDYVDLGNTEIAENVSALTVSAWVKSATGSSGERAMVSQWGSGADTFYFVYDASANILFYVKNQAQTLGTGRFTNGIEDIDWHHVVGVYDGANVFVYVDTIKGDVIGDLTTNTGSSLLNVFIGESTNDHWPGLIDDVRVYNRALSAEEVERLYNMGR